jgi:hypothetical protein
MEEGRFARALYAAVHRGFVNCSYEPRLYEAGRQMAIDIIPDSLMDNLDAVVERGVGTGNLGVHKFLNDYILLTDSDVPELFWYLPALKNRINQKSKRWYDFMRTKRSKEIDRDVLGLVVGAYILEEADKRGLLIVDYAFDDVRRPNK